MIISASRRTDIPAFYSIWLLNRIRAGFCQVPNPYNSKQIGLVRLDSHAVDALVFWTRSPRPLLPMLTELDRGGYRYYFQYTLLDYPRGFEAQTPPAARAVTTFRELADRIGAERVIWRYDPIVISAATPPDFHRRSFERLARMLQGATQRVVISFVDEYAKTRRRMAALSSAGGGVVTVAADASGALPAEIGALTADLAACASACGMEIQSCAETLDLRPFGVSAGKCIDSVLIERIFGLHLQADKDPNQRPACGCALSKDIGMYDSCLFGCSYCYATTSFERSLQNYARHDPNAPALFSLPK